MLEKLWGEGEFTEGGALAGDGSILFSDIGDRIMRFDPETGKTTVFREPSGRANGLIFDPAGRLIAAEGANTGGNRRVSITERDGTVRTLADRYQGKRFNSPNDVAVDRKGGSMSPTRATSAPSPASSTSRPSSGSTPTAPSPAGHHRPQAQRPGVSPDGKTLYVADNGRKRRALLALDLDADGRRLAPPRHPRLRRRPGHRRHDRHDRRPDRRRRRLRPPRRGVYVFSPEGKLLATIPTPEAPANVEFGGPDRKTLYIMAGKSLYRISTTMTGFHSWPPGR